MTPPCVAFGASPPGGRRQRPGGAGSAASAGARWWARVALAFWLAFAALGAWAESGAAGSSAAAGGMSTPNAVPQPLIEKARAGTQCVADPAFMRRNHMNLLKHQRDDTLRGGVRTGRHSLKECIACHASQTTQSVNASSSDFCQSCHAYAAVKIDCFECHASKPPDTTFHPLLPPGNAGNASLNLRLRQMVVQQQQNPSKTP